MVETVQNTKKEFDNSLEMILRKNIQFLWLFTEKRWGEFSEEDLMRLVVVIASEMEITPEQAEQIHIAFGDNFHLQRNDLPQISTALNISFGDESGKYFKHQILLDRYQTIQSYGRNPNITNYSHQNAIELRSNLELLIWLIVEELNHAKVQIKAATTHESDKRQNKYESLIAKKGKKIQSEYDKSLLEMTAIREVLRTLIKLLTPIDPQRAEYFRKFYQRLKVTNEHMALSTEHIPVIPYWNWKEVKRNPLQRWKHNQKLKRVAE